MNYTERQAERLNDQLRTGSYIEGYNDNSCIMKKTITAEVYAEFVADIEAALDVGLYNHLQAYKDEMCWTEWRLKGDIAEPDTLAGWLFAYEKKLNSHPLFCEQSTMDHSLFAPKDPANASYKKLHQFSPCELRSYWIYSSNCGIEFSLSYEISDAGIHNTKVTFDVRCMACNRDIDRGDLSRIVKRWSKWVNSVTAAQRH